MQLFESDIFIQIGGQAFQVSRELFSSPGNSPNFFTLGFAVFFTSPAKAFPGLRDETLLRPPSVTPPAIPNRSGDIFADLVHLLKGYPLHIRDEEHRQQLLQDCRYYHLRGLEQKLIPHEIRFDSVQKLTEVVIRLEDLRRSGLSIATDGLIAGSTCITGRIMYARPFLDESGHELVLEIGNNCTVLNFDIMTASFNLEPRATELSNLLGAVAKQITPWLEKLSADTAVAQAAQWHLQASSKLVASKYSVIFRMTSDTHVTLDGDTYTQHLNWSGERSDDVFDPPCWYVTRGQWRLRLEPCHIVPTDFLVVLLALKLDARRGQGAINAQRVFLGN